MAGSNAPACADCQYLADSRSFPGKGLPDTVPGRPWLKYYYCGCPDCPYYGRRIDGMGLRSCPFFEEL